MKRPEADHEAYQRRLHEGWRPGRTGFGFLVWRRGGEWQTMTEDEAMAFWEAQ